MFWKQKTKIPLNYKTDIVYYGYSKADGKKFGQIWPIIPRRVFAGLPVAKFGDN